MLIAFGFLVAALIALLVAPSFWARAVRLTTRRITETLPITEAEIKADRDRLRAEYAMTVHRLESRIEEADLKRARFLVDLNRREAKIADLESELTTVRTTVEEHENARRVLEATVRDQLPRLDTRLADARKLISERDAELATLTDVMDKQVTALAEASAINAQQAAEIERLSASLAVTGARSSNSLQDARSDAEVALRAEIDTLRARAREQAAHIARLETAAAIASQNEGKVVVAKSPPPIALVASTPSTDAEKAKLEKENRELKAEVAASKAKLEKAKAELETRKAAESADKPDKNALESALSLKARLAGLEAEQVEHIKEIDRLKATIGTLTAQLSQQAAEYSEHLRRAGAGTVPVASPVAASGEAAARRLSLAERITQTRLGDGRSGGASASQSDSGEERETSADRVGPQALPASNGGEQARKPIDSVAKERFEDAASGARGKLVDRISSASKT